MVFVNSHWIRGPQPWWS